MDGMLKVSDSLFAADPDSHRSRLLRALHRHKYSVEGSNALWHVDWNHKLIRWRVVIHGGIDDIAELFSIYVQQRKYSVTCLHVWDSRIWSTLKGAH